MSSCLVDINVWLALIHSEHVHYGAASEWFAAFSGTAYFCRFTQLGLLRLLTNARVMGKSVRGQREAWRIYDLLLQDARIDFLREPLNMELAFRELTQSAASAHHTWADAYLGAFAQAAGLQVVSFDRVFHSMRGVDAVVLKA